MSEIRIASVDKANIIEVSDGRLVVVVPIQIKRRGGRKRVTSPDGELMKSGPVDRSPTPSQQALVRGFRWLGMLERGEGSSLKDIARREKVDDSYVSRMVNLTNLAPEIVSAILTDKLPANITLFDLAVDLPAIWDEQRRLMRSADRSSLGLGERPR